jgi:error-prone DNA polymerase
MSDYVPLWVKSNYSFLEGASHPDELVEAASEKGLKAIALTDRDGVHGVVRAHVKAKELGVKLLIGAEVHFADAGDMPNFHDSENHLSSFSGSDLGQDESVENDESDQREELSYPPPLSPSADRILLYAATREGYATLCRLITLGRRRAPKGQSRLFREDLLALGDDARGLIALTPELGEPDFDARAFSPLRDLFGDRLYAMLPRHCTEHDRMRELRTRARRLDLPLVATNEVLYHTPSRRRLQDVLTAIRHRTPLALAGRLLRPNAEHDLKASHPFCARFEDLPEAVAHTLEVASRVTFSLDELRYRYPAERLPDGMSSIDHLRALTLEGAKSRYGAVLPAAVRDQLERELALIDELDYCGYFLTMHEIVRFCRAQDILCQGRGSAANSAVCYCLGITAVDPIRLDLLFERFISRERAEPPDIDLDIMHARREEVIQHVFSRYGREHAAMVANVIRFRGRSALREVGKTLGLPETDLDRVSKQLSHFGGLDDEGLRHSGLEVEAARSPLWAHLLELAHEIQDFPRHLSIHPGGFLLGHEPVHAFVPIENATMEGRTVIQWDKYDVEALGLFKVDLLGLGALTHLDGAFRLLARHRGLSLSMADIPPEDVATYDLCGRGDTVGVFQIESRAQMSMLPRLRPKTFYDLVVEVSIVRPGPITGGMVHPYLRRRSGEEPVTYPHPSLEPVLQKTLGIPLFQEQVMKLAVVAADYTPGEADQLRRDMAAWRRSGAIEKHRDKLVHRMEGKGIAREFAERIFEQIRGFGEYGFPESHAASFALIAYATAWLKCHFHAEFSCALLNALPMGFYAPSTLVEDARRHGVEVRPIDVLYSNWDCSLEPLAGPGERFAIRMGLRFIKGLAAHEGRRIELMRQAIALEVLDAMPQEARKSNISEIELMGPVAFDSLAGFVRAVRLPVRTLRLLAEAGALEGFGLDRRQALWTLEGLAATVTPLPLEDAEATPLLMPLRPAEVIGWDYRRTHHSTRGHPIAPLREALSRHRIPDAKTLSSLGDGQRARYVGLVICRQRPPTAGGVMFMTLEDETGFVNVICWKAILERFHLLAKTASFLGVSGRLQVDGGVINLVAEHLFAPEPLVMTKVEAPRARDFR